MNSCIEYLRKRGRCDDCSCKILQEARALLGRLEYQRGNIEAALRVFDGIDLQSAIQRFKPASSEKLSKRNRSRTESPQSLSQHAASLVLEAIYLKSMSLRKLGKSTGTIDYSNCQFIFLYKYSFSIFIMYTCIL